MRPWNERSIEQAGLFNPAFLAAVLASASRGAEEHEGLAWPLSFLVVPLVLHRPTREALPRGVTTSLPVWIERVPEARVGFAQRARDLAPFTREGARLGLRAGSLELAGDRLRRGTIRRRTRAVRASAERDDCLTRAEFVGRWLAGSGDVVTVFGLFGVRP
jgi:Family of unknown function (DUF6521)